MSEYCRTRGGKRVDFTSEADAKDAIESIGDVTLLYNRFKELQAIFEGVEIDGVVEPVKTGVGLFNDVTEAIAFCNDNQKSIAQLVDEDLNPALRLAYDENAGEPVVVGPVDLSVLGAAGGLGVTITDVGSASGEWVSGGLIAPASSAVDHCWLNLPIWVKSLPFSLIATLGGTLTPGASVMALCGVRIDGANWSWGGVKGNATPALVGYSGARTGSGGTVDNADATEISGDVVEVQSTISHVTNAGSNAAWVYGDPNLNQVGVLSAAQSVYVASIRKTVVNPTFMGSSSSIIFTRIG